MFEGAAVAKAFLDCGITDVVWLPDSDLGRWNEALTQCPGLRLIRVCREGEAFAVAAGLWLGGRRPIVIMQCTGLFEAGDALRNFIHDLGIPLFLIIGLRGWYAHQQQRGSDTCPRFAEPILRAWQIPFQLLTDQHTLDDLLAAYRAGQAKNQAAAVLLAE